MSYLDLHNEYLSVLSADEAIVLCQLGLNSVLIAHIKEEHWYTKKNPWRRCYVQYTSKAICQNIEDTKKHLKSLHKKGFISLRRHGKKNRLWVRLNYDLLVKKAHEACNSPNFPLQADNDCDEIKPPDDYAKYLQSKSWKIIRKRILQRDRNRCLLCNNAAQIVHHTCYDADVLEGKNDLKLGSVCKPCHVVAHNSRKARKKLNKAISKAGAS